MLTLYSVVHEPKKGLGSQYYYWAKSHDEAIEMCRQDVGAGFWANFIVHKVYASNSNKKYRGYIVQEDDES